MWNVPGNNKNNVYFYEQTGCFPSTARVHLENGKVVTMSELQVGDRVQTGMDLLLFWHFFKKLLSYVQKVNII